MKRFIASLPFLSLFLATPALAHSGLSDEVATEGIMEGSQHGIGMMGNFALGGNYEWMAVFHWVTMLLVWTTLILLIVFLIKKLKK